MAGVPLPGGNPGVGGLDLVPGDPPGELLLLPNPEGGVLNHGGQNLQGAEPQNKRSEDKLIFKVRKKITGNNLSNSFMSLIFTLKSLICLFFIIVWLL